MIINFVNNSMRYNGFDGRCGIDGGNYINMIRHRLKTGFSRLIAKDYEGE